MSALKLSSKMEKALLAAHAGDTKQIVPYATAVALESRRLVTLGSQETGGSPRFPAYQIRLTESGMHVARSLQRSKNAA
jgi:hypothetical protein